MAECVFPGAEFLPVVRYLRDIRCIEVPSKEYRLVSGSFKYGRERIDTRLGREILPYAESLGLGSREYELVEI